MRSKGREVEMAAVSVGRKLLNKRNAVIHNSAFSSIGTQRWGLHISDFLVDHPLSRRMLLISEATVDPPFETEETFVVVAVRCVELVPHQNADLFFHAMGNYLHHQVLYPIIDDITYLLDDT